MLSKLIPEEKIENLGKKGIPHAEAGGALVERASWRTFKPTIDYTKCTKCGMCWLHCPDAAYTIGKDGFPICDSKTCKGCLLCIDVCPVKCIKAEQERGLLKK
jgi:2-oxoacid:acceptor oxidoreductase delta subunit (pyruvate/2-ketoisovalerate family)